MSGMITISVKGPKKDPALAWKWNVQRGFGGRSENNYVR